MIKKYCSSLIICIALSAITCPLTSAKAVVGGNCGDTLSYVLQDEGALTISGSGETYTDFEWADLDKKAVKRIEIDNGMTAISDYTFSSFENVTEITIPSSVTNIGEGAFEDCKSLEVIILPKDVTVISSRTFFGCESLKAIAIPYKLTEIQRLAFSGCDSLEYVYYAGSETHWEMIDFGQRTDILFPNASIIYYATHIHTICDKLAISDFVQDCDPEGLPYPYLSFDVFFVDKSASVTGDIYAVLYDENGKFLSFRRSEATSSTESNRNTASFNAIDCTNAKHLKVICLEKSCITPLSSPISITLQ